MLPSACGLGQHFQDLGHSFSLYGPPSRQITYISSHVKRSPSLWLHNKSHLFHRSLSGVYIINRILLARCAHSWDIESNTRGHVISSIYLISVMSYHLFTFFYQWDAFRRCNADMMMMDLVALQNALNLACTYFVHCDCICSRICLLTFSPRGDRGQIMMMNCICFHTVTR